MSLFRQSKKQPFLEGGAGTQTWFFRLQSTALYHYIKQTQLVSIFYAHALVQFKFDMQKVSGSIKTYPWEARLESSVLRSWRPLI